MRRARGRLVVLAAAALTAAALLPAPQAGPAPRQSGSRDVFTDIGKVRGPLADFWIKVRSEWGGYVRGGNGLGPSGGFLQSTLATQALPGRAWVSLAYSDLTADGRPTAMSHLFNEFLLEYRRAEGRNWPYAQIYDRTWNKLSEMARKQNLIMVGAPWHLEPVGPLAEKMGFNISHGKIDIGKRRYRGDNLILLFIAPNPSNKDKYALVVTGTSDEALLQADHLPYGDTDYALFRGRRLLESGFFSKKGPEGDAPPDADGRDGAQKPEWGPPVSWEARGTHRNFAVRESKHYTFLYEQGRLAPEQLEELLKSKEAAWPSLAALLPVDPDDPPRIIYYLYPSVDRKIDETSRDEVVHLDLAAGEIHTVYSDTQRMVEPYLDLQILLHRTVGPTRVPRLERSMAIALAPDFQGRDVAAIAAQVLAGLRGHEGEALKALRDQDVMTPADGPPAAHDVMLAGFVKDVIQRHGKEKAFVYLSKASPRGLSSAFQDVYGSDLGDALETWARAAGAGAQTAAAGAASGGARAGDTDRAAQLVARGTTLLQNRRDAEASAVLQEALTMDPRQPVALASLARLKFRAGQFDASDADVDNLMRACPGRQAAAGCPEALAWGRLTRGRIEAMRGRLVAARMELTHADVTEGPVPVPTLADYWLETMGFSRNQLTVVSHLKREANVSLRNLEWREAETSLKKALEIDPSDGEAHRLLSEVYHKEHEYWAWRVRYLNDVQPDYNLLERVYFMDSQGEMTSISRVENLHSLDVFNDLVLRGNVELLKAQSLYAVEIQNLHAEGDRFLLEHKDIESALKVYSKALELNDSFFLSHFLVGRCYFLLDRHDEAMSSFEQVLQHDPSDALVIAWTWTYLGYIHMQREELSEAQRAFEKALSARSEGKVAGMAREGLARVNTIRLLLPTGNGRP